MTTTPLKDLSDQQLAGLVLKASNRQIDSILHICENSAVQLPNTAINLINTLGTKSPSNTKTRQFIKLKRHLLEKEWSKAITTNNIHNWTFKAKISNNTHIQSSFYLECLRANPRLCLSILNNDDLSQHGKHHQQLLAHLYRYYIKGIKTKNHLIQVAQNAIHILESNGVRTEPDNRFLLPFTLISKDSTLFEERPEKHNEFYLLCTNKKYICKLKNFSQLTCLQHKGHHQQFTDQLCRYWSNQCAELSSADNIEATLIHDARTTTKLLLKMLPPNTIIPDSMHKALEKLSKIK